MFTEYPMCIVLSMNLYKENRCTHVKGFCQRCKRKGQSEGEENVDWKFSLNQFGPNCKIVSREKQWVNMKETMGKINLTGFSQSNWTKW